MDEDVISTEVTDTEVDTTGDEGVATPDADEPSAENVETSAEPDYWEELKSKGYDPRKLEKSFTRFTTELEGVKSMEKELEPFKQLKDAIESDPKLYAALERALAEADDETDVDSLKREVDGLKTQIRTKEELTDLTSWAAEKGYPEVDPQEVLKHAVYNNIGNLKSAYRDLHFDAIEELARTQALKDVQRGQNAKTMHSGGSQKKSSTTWTPASIAALSSEEFLKNQDSIMEYYDTLRK